jgi:RecA/RadA recombinase
MSKTFTFEDLNKELSKISTFGDTLDKSEVSTVDHYISTGNYALNAALTGSVWGGFPNNRSVAIAGPSGTGKTYLILNAVREAQKMGYSIIYYDSENAVDRSLTDKFGIDPARLRYEPCNTVQEFRSSVTNLTKAMLEAKKKGSELPRIMVILDSAGNLATQKEIDDAASGSDKSDMTRARLLKSTFRILMTQMGICKIPFLFTNHVYQTQDLFSKQVAGGGCLAPESLIIMADGSFKKIEDVDSGDLVKTLIGDKEVLQTWEFEKESYEVEFEDGSKIICSEDHRFYIGEHDDDWSIEEGWISIKDLKEGEYIKQVAE